MNNPQVHCCNFIFPLSILSIMSKEEAVDLNLMEQLFNKYKNQYINERMAENQNENLRYWHERKDKEKITLSQIDHWMYETKIIPKIFTIFDTGIVFAKLK